MLTLALNIRMQGKLVVIVGGGAVAARKLKTVLMAGAHARVVAREICPEISELKNSEAVEIREGSYMATDLDNAFLAVAATDDSTTNEKVRGEAEKRGIMVTVADNPSAGDCTFPVVLQRGDLKIAVSTGGRCPTFAVDVRDQIAGHIGSEYGVILEQLAAAREKLLTNGSSSTYNATFLRSLAKRLIAEFTERKEPLP
ncbi:MAG TPA: bifunctional precorrin-2 dehydrogenase/sirohydrochlorin ferrochelatase [Desulfuromonadales bacterium]|nr:bifunctional precorrin-2 dehydrogenase/sirohydrochlorin ferrochelatase [Desulfuromonadales bacterium]